MASNKYPQFRRMISKHFRPQDDLYRHVNGNWIKKTKIPETESVWGSFYELRENNQKKLHKIASELTRQKRVTPNSVEQKVRDFYVSAVKPARNKKSMQKLDVLFERVDKVRNLNALSRLIGELHLYGIYAFWQIYIEPDEKNSNKYVLRLYQGGLSLPNRDYYLLKDKNFQRLRSEFLAHIPKMMQLLDCEVTHPEETLNIETRLAAASRTSIELRDVEALYNEKRLAGLQKLAPAVNWKMYFTALGINPPTRLVADIPEFVSEASKLWSDTELDLLKQYIKWQILRVAAPRLGEKIARANFEFFGKQLLGAKKIQPSWKRAITAIDVTIGEALGRLYVERYFPAEAKRRMDLLVADIKAAFAQRLKQLDWMDTKTKKAALKKLEAMNVKIGHAKKLENYRSLVIAPDDYLGNFLSAKKYESKRHLRKLPKPVDPNDWFMTPPTVNAYFSPNRNEMVFPAGILQPPFFNFEADDAVNYAGIGAVIGHEITHGFDDQGCLFDHRGNRKNWWDKTTKLAFDKRAKMMVRLGNQYWPLPKHSMKGKLTLGENIADLGGAEIAYTALQLSLHRNGLAPKIDGMAAEERFFMNFALCECSKMRPQLLLQALLTDPHAPGEFRVNNTVRNMDSFYKVFNVSNNDKMYLAPSKRVKIW